MLGFNEYQRMAHETASYPEGCVGGINANHTSWLYPALGLAEEAGGSKR